MYSYLGRTINRFVWDPVETPYYEKDENILFIGNSYTGYHQLPLLVKEVFEFDMRNEDDNNNNKKTSGDGKDEHVDVHVESHTPPGESFAGHRNGLENGHLFHRCKYDYYYRGTHLRRWLLPPTNTSSSSAGSQEHHHQQQQQQQNYYWKWITLQDFSRNAGYWNSSDDKQKAAFEESVEAAKYINDIIVQNYPNSNTLFIMTWGRPGQDSRNPKYYIDYPTMQEYLKDGYIKYVQATSTSNRPTYVAPVGLVFRTIYNDILKSDSNIDPTKPGTLFYQLYDNGDHHPSILGSYIYALTVYATITGNDVKKLNWIPKNSKSGELLINEDIAATLRDAVSRTIQETTDKHIIQYPWQQ